MAIHLMAEEFTIVAWNHKSMILRTYQSLWYETANTSYGGYLRLL